MKHLPTDILQELKKKGFTGDCFCEAIDWFRETHNIFIGYTWMIDEPANRVVFYFKIDYMWGYREKEKSYADWAKRNNEVKVEKWSDEPDDCHLESIKEALKLIG